MSQTGFNAPGSIRGVYALIVGGDARQRALLTAVLLYCGAYVQSANTVARALELIQQIRPDVVVADFSDVGPRLIDAVRERKTEHGGLVPAIALGASNLERIARDRGYDAFLTVPVVPWELCRVVGTFARL